MTGDTITAPGAATKHPHPSASFTASRAARELGLRRGEFDLAVQLGRIRTFIDAPRAEEPPRPIDLRRRVTCAEIDRIRDTTGFPESLRVSISTVSGVQGAQLMSITTTRFTRLARLGLLVPVTFYVNRYRTVVWLYLAEELRTFAGEKANEVLLTTRLPETLRSQLDSGIDLRARNWRGRHAGFLLRLTEDPWARAAVTASFLDSDDLADVVDDPHERAYVSWLKPERADQSVPGSLSAQVADDLLTADDPDEIQWLRASLVQHLAEARKARAAPGVVPTALCTGHPYSAADWDGRPSSDTAHDVDSSRSMAPSRSEASGDPPVRQKGLLARLRRGRWE